MANEKRLIDADEAIRISKEGRFMWVYDLTDLEEFLTGVPTVDAVEVVRCKDCRKSRPLNRNDRLENRYGDGCIWCMEHSDGMGEDDFCSYGERRSDGDKSL